jgi:hypothetical protein
MKEAMAGQKQRAPSRRRQYNDPSSLSKDSAASKKRQQHFNIPHHPQTRQKAKYGIPKKGIAVLIDAGIEPAIS